MAEIFKCRNKSGKQQMISLCLNYKCLCSSRGVKCSASPTYYKIKRSLYRFFVIRSTIRDKNAPDQGNDTPRASMIYIVIQRKIRQDKSLLIPCWAINSSRNSKRIGNTKYRLTIYLNILYKKNIKKIYCQWKKFKKLHMDLEKLHMVGMDKLSTVWCTP